MTIFYKNELLQGIKITTVKLPFDFIAKRLRFDQVSILSITILQYQILVTGIKLTGSQLNYH